MANNNKKSVLDNIETKPYFKKITTPKGTARFPALLEPDMQFSTEGEYHTGIVVDPEDPEVSKLIDWLKEKIDNLYQEVYNLVPKKDKNKVFCHYPWEDEYDKDDEPTGNIVIKFRSKAEITKNGKTYDLKPALFDAKRQPWDETNPIYGGSTIKVSTSTSPYYIPSTGMCGIKLRLNAVQVISALNRRTAEAFGFDDEGDDEDEDVADTSDYDGNDGGGDDEDDDVSF